MSGIDWFDTESWGSPGRNVHESATGSQVKDQHGDEQEEDS